MDCHTNKDDCNTSSHATSVHRVAEGNQNVKVDFYKFLEIFVVHLDSKDTYSIFKDKLYSLCFITDKLLFMKEFFRFVKKLFTFVV
jgi:hypothetical protein